MDDASEIADPALGFDPDALRDKYRQERDKRLRQDGEAQYIEVAGEFARFAEEDPYADPAFTRSPLTDEIEIAVIGGGFSGLLAAARLREAGLDDFRIIEAGGDFGGTGTGIGIPAPSATSKATVICRCSKNSATYRKRSTRTSTRSSSTPSVSVAPMASMSGLASRPGSPGCAGTRR